MNTLLLVIIVPEIVSSKLDLDHLQQGACIKLSSAHCSIISRSNANPLLSFWNSSSDIIDICIHSRSISSLLRVSMASALTMNNCTIFSLVRQMVSLFECDGDLILTNFIILSPSVLPSIAVSDTSRMHSVSLSHSRFESVAVDLNAGSFLSSGQTDAQEVRKCIFTNVSVIFSRKTGASGISVCEYCTLKDSEIVNGEEGIYGELISGLTSNTHDSFVCTNNSFAHTYRSSKIHRVHQRENKNLTYENKKYDFHQTLDAGTSYVFTNCTFTVTSSEYGAALYLAGFVNIYLSITILNCLFENCSSQSYAGAIHCTASVVTITSSSFINCSSLIGAGGASISTVSDCTVVSGCLFQECSAGWGGGLDFFGCNATASDCEGSVYGIVHDCFFTTCSGSSGEVTGGGLRLNQMEQVTVRSCQFNNCSSCCNGGAIAWDNPNSTQFSINRWIYYCIFFNNSASYNGSDLFIHSNREISQTIFESSYTLSDAENRVTLLDRDKTSWLPFNTSLSIYITSGTAGNDCLCIKPSKTACTSLSVGMNVGGMIIGSSLFSVKLQSGTHSSDMSEISLGTWIVDVSASEDVDTVTLSIPVSFSPESSVFILASGSLTLKSFNITLNRRLGSGCSLVEITADGELTLSSMQISGYDTNCGTTDRSLLNIGNGMLRSADSNISTVNRKTGNGGAVYVSVAASKTLSLDSISFSGCSASKGGAMYIVLEDETSQFVFIPSSATFSPRERTEYSLVYIEAADGYAWRTQ